MKHGSKAAARLVLRVAAHTDTVAADKANNGRGYRKPGSLNPKKSWPLDAGKRRRKGRSR